MKYLVAIAVLLAGCGHEPIGRPGDLKIWTSRVWYVGEPAIAEVSWDYTCAGTGDWECKAASEITVLRVSCRGCELREDVVGKVGVGRVSVPTIATQDGDLEIVARVRFEDTGDETEARQSVTGDHEVALAPRCYAIDTEALDRQPAMTHVPPELFHPCTTTRLATETIVLVPALRTFNGELRYPFCVDGDCADSQRPLSSILVEPAATQGSAELGAFFRVPATVPDDTVTLSAPLADGTRATVAVTLPPVRKAIR